MSTPLPATLIIGGSGRVARHITRLLTTTSTPVYSLIRSATHTPTLQSLGATAIVESIEDSTPQDCINTLQSTKVRNIIFAAGAGGKGGPERTKAVDRDAAILWMEAAAEAGVRRFVMVSAVDTRDRGMAEPEWYTDVDRERSIKSREVLGRYYEAKLAADKNLVTNNARRNLDYTIVRPTTLTEDSGTGTIEAGKCHLDAPISREDVAAAVVECLRQEGTIGLAFDISGGKTPISDAIATVAKERIDAFEGRY